jgi:hypothetical protein
VGDRTDFTLYRQLFGVTFWRHYNRTAKVNLETGFYGETKILIDAMSEVERHWLKQEIQDWLDASPPHRASSQSQLKADFP